MKEEWVLAQWTCDCCQTTAKTKWRRGALEKSPLDWRYPDWELEMGLIHMACPECYGAISEAMNAAARERCEGEGRMKNDDPNCGPDLIDDDLLIHHEPNWSPVLGDLLFIGMVVVAAVLYILVR